MSKVQVVMAKVTLGRKRIWDGFVQQPYNLDKLIRVEDVKEISLSKKLLYDL